MTNFFEVKVTYEKLQENGMVKKVTESYLIDALSWAEAEARTIEEMKPYISGEFTITDIKMAKISELFLSDSGGKFFKAKVQFIALDERSGMEKKTNSYILAQADDIDQAQDVIKEGMKGTISDYVIAEVKETKIMDVFPVGPKKDK